MDAGTIRPGVAHQPTPYGLGQWATCLESGPAGGPCNGPPSLKALAAKALLASGVGRPVGQSWAEASQARPRPGTGVGQPPEVSGESSRLRPDRAGAASASPDTAGLALALAELDRFIATAVNDGAGGWADPEYLANLGTSNIGHF